MHTPNNVKALVLWEKGVNYSVMKVIGRNIVFFFLTKIEQKLKNRKKPVFHGI